MNTNNNDYEKTKISTTELEQLKKDIDKLVNETLRKNQNNYKQSYNEIKEDVAEKYGQVKKQLEEKRKKFDNQVRENPEKSLLITAGIGALIALLISRIIKNK